MKRMLVWLTLALTVAPVTAKSADNLKLKPDLDFVKNSWQGPIIEGDNLGDGIVKGATNFVFMYAEFCYNAKRQALRTVELYRDYSDRVHFVIIDLSRPIPRRAQMPLVKKFFRQDFPQTTIIDANGKVVFDYIGEADDATLMGWLDAALRSGSTQQAANSGSNLPMDPAAAAPKSE